MNGTHQRVESTHLSEAHIDVGIVLDELLEIIDNGMHIRFILARSCLLELVQKPWLQICVVAWQPVACNVFVFMKRLCGLRHDEMKVCERTGASFKLVKVLN